MEVHWKISLNTLLLIICMSMGASAQSDHGQLDSLAHDLKWGALDSASGLYLSTYPDSSWGYYYKAKALHGLLLHDSALHYLDAYPGNQEPEHFLLFEVERGGVWNSKNQLDVADSVFRSCEERYLPNGFPNFTAAYQLYDRWAENRWFAGKPFESEELLRKGLPFIAPDDNRLIARINNNLGIVNWQLGRFVEALNYFQAAESAYRKAYGDEDSRVAKALNNQGVVYLDMADNKRAQRHFDAALEILKHAETDVNNTYFAYSNLSIIALEEERWNQALDLSQQALDLLSRGQGNAIARMMEPLEVQAAVWRALGQADKSLAVLLRADSLLKTISPEHSGRTPLLQQQADIYLEQHRAEKAGALLAEAEELFLKNNSHKHPGFAALMIRRAEIARSMGNSEEAMSFTKSALEVFALDGISPHLSDYWISDQLLPAAEMYGDLLLESGQVDGAMKYWNLGLDAMDEVRRRTVYLKSQTKLAEKADQLHTKLVQELLGQWRNNAVNSEVLIYAVERSKAFSMGHSMVLAQDSSLRSLMLERAYWEKQLAQSSNDEGVRQAQMSLVEMDRQFDERIAELGASLFSEVAERTQRLMDLSRTIPCIAYFMRSELSLVLVIDSGELSVFELEPLDETTLANFTASYSDADLVFNHPRRSDSLLFSGSGLISRQLLEPFYSMISTSHEWIISPDASLSGLRWELLAIPGSMPTTSYQSYPYLMKSHAVSYVPSLLSIPASRHLDQPQVSYWGYAIVGNAIHHETEALQKAFHPDVFLDDRCTESQFRNYAHRYEMIHLSCHGTKGMNPFETRLLLHPDSLNDGELTLAETTWLGINPAFLSLSACESGDGEVVFGEWTQSVAYGFARAGTPTILSAAWQIPNESTAGVMAEFYRLLSDGVSSSEALRQAQLSALAGADALHAHPYYWAGMTHMGADLTIAPQRGAGWFIAFLPGVVVLIVLVARRRRYKGA